MKYWVIVHFCLWKEQIYNILLLKLKTINSRKSEVQYPTMIFCDKIQLK